VLRAAPGVRALQLRGRLPPRSSRHRTHHHLEAMVIDDDDVSAWPDYLPDGWVDEPVDPVDRWVVMFVAVFVALVFIAVMVVRV
jgi:hypothetical protein